ncbi:hypothetical protein PT2222_230081 [Paraburkholderia tropica]
MEDPQHDDVRPLDARLSRDQSADLQHESEPAEPAGQERQVRDQQRVEPDRGERQVRSLRHAPHAHGGRGVQPRAGSLRGLSRHRFEGQQHPLGRPVLGGVQLHAARQLEPEQSVDRQRAAQRRQDLPRPGDAYADQHRLGVSVRQRATVAALDLQRGRALRPLRRDGRASGCGESEQHVEPVQLSVRPRLQADRHGEPVRVVRHVGESAGRELGAGRRHRPAHGDQSGSRAGAFAQYRSGREVGRARPPSVADDRAVPDRQDQRARERRPGRHDQRRFAARARLRIRLRGQRDGKVGRVRRLFVSRRDHDQRGSDEPGALRPADGDGAQAQLHAVDELRRAAEAEHRRGRDGVEPDVRVGVGDLAQMDAGLRAFRRLGDVARLEEGRLAAQREQHLRQEVLPERVSDLRDLGAGPLGDGHAELLSVMRGRKV